MEARIFTSYNFSKMMRFIFFQSFILISCNSNETGLITDDNIKDLAENNSVYSISKLQFESAEMEIGNMELMSFDESLKSNGIIDVNPQNKVTVSTYFGGTIKEINYLPGQKVTKGDVLFTLENPEFIKMQQDYLEAKEQLVYLKSDFERQKKLVADFVTSEKNYLKAESDYLIMKIKVEALGKNLNLMGLNVNEISSNKIQTTILVNSPISGFVTEVNAIKGEYLLPSKSAITVINTDQLFLNLNVFEQDLDKIKLNQKIKFIIQGNSKVYNASVRLINKAVDIEKRTITINGIIDEKELNNPFTYGMFVEANIFIKSEIKNALPSEAIVEIEGKNYILVVKSFKNNMYSLVKNEVIVGKTNNLYSEILNFKTIPTNTKIVTKGAFNIIN